MAAGQASMMRAGCLGDSCGLRSGVGFDVTYCEKGLGGGGVFYGEDGGGGGGGEEGRDFRCCVN